MASTAEGVVSTMLILMKVFMVDAQLLNFIITLCSTAAAAGNSPFSPLFAVYCPVGLGTRRHP